MASRGLAEFRRPNVDPGSVRTGRPRRALPRARSIRAGTFDRKTDAKGSIPLGISHRRAYERFRKSGFDVVREGKHIVMSDGARIGGLSERSERRSRQIEPE